jgi:hypothetical protein
MCGIFGMVSKVNQSVEVKIPLVFFLELIITMLSSKLLFRSQIY